MKTPHIIAICLTIYLSVFTNGCWNAVNAGINKYEFSTPKEEKIENPILQNDLPQLFIIPTPELQDTEPTEDNSKPKIFANN